MLTPSLWWTNAEVERERTVRATRDEFAKSVEIFRLADGASPMTLNSSPYFEEAEGTSNRRVEQSHRVREFHPAVDFQLQTAAAARTWC
jgi:hypothetical protein